MTVPPSTAGYARDAAALIAQYERCPLEKVFAAILDCFPVTPCSILDIGAGTGRHAASLAKRGHTVVAIEPTKELREAGMRLHADAPVVWLDDALPELAVLHNSSHAAPYEFILMAAVIMHFDATERQAILAKIAELLVPNGRCVMSLRHGPIPEGRRMFPVAFNDLAAQAKEFGLACTKSVETNDLAARPGVSWTLVCLDKLS